MALTAFGYMRREIYPHYTIGSNTETYAHSYQGQNFTAARYVLHCKSGFLFIWKQNAQTLGFYKLSVLPSPLSRHIWKSCPGSCRSDITCKCNI